MPRNRRSEIISITQQKRIKRLTKNELYNMCLSLTEELMAYRAIAQEAQRRAAAESASTPTTEGSTNA